MAGFIPGVLRMASVDCSVPTASAVPTRPRRTGAKPKASGTAAAASPAITSNAGVVATCPGSTPRSVSVVTAPASGKPTSWPTETPSVRWPNRLSIVPGGDHRGIKL
ncbi:hypothetical protein SAMN05216207_101892 [Pseudonocardia ammonioxydans]|uniref:Uncharacterized protein n=1 Tax=Pseudonocardia ammonioxydans TaxID=260086 RepID=A0A1I5AQI6_PSUAM|nr:hypothetical protein SAMN05216207_101892 [Pseudonocardia ammonioxydans]